MTNFIRNIFPVILFLAILAIGGCGSSPRDSRLSEIALIISDSPEDALKRLGDICPDSLSGSDRHYLDLLTIKAKDKAYIRHTSDSLILDVLSYASSHQSEGYYPEALYYAGRVFGDIGDYPTSLKYFQSALETMDENTSDITLKANTLSQISSILSHMRLYDEAIQYHEKVLELLPPKKKLGAQCK